MTGIITEFQNQSYPHDDTGKVIDIVKEEAGKVNVQEPEERRSFIRFTESLPDYRAQTEFDNSQQCFDVTLERSGSQISLDCIGGSSSQVEEVRLVSMGFNARQGEGGTAPIPPGETEGDYGGVYDAENGRKLHDGSRSYAMSVYNLNTDSFDYHRNYDLHDSSDGDNEAERLASDIQDINGDSSKIVLITTQDQPQKNRRHGDLEDEMYNLGASPEIYGADEDQFMYRSAYVLVGRPGLGQGNAYIEEYAGEEDRSPDAWVDVTFELS